MGIVETILYIIYLQKTGEVKMNNVVIEVALPNWFLNKSMWRGF